MFEYTNTVQAETINAGFVMNKMSGDEQVSYIAGVVEGLAFSRYLRDKPDLSGMKCVYGWYANNSGSAEKVKKREALFTKYPGETDWCAVICID